MSSSASAGGFEAFDQLATMVALVEPDGRCLRANAALENQLSLPRRALQRSNVAEWLIDASQLSETLLLVAANQVTSARFDAQLKRLAVGGAEWPVHVIVSQTEFPGHVLVEMIEVEQQTRQEREERAQAQALSNKELVRNLFLFCYARALRPTSELHHKIEL